MNNSNVEMNLDKVRFEIKDKNNELMTDFTLQGINFKINITSIPDLTFIDDYLYPL
jgi:hypothetical protein